MGNCNCMKEIDRSEMKIEVGRAREIENYFKTNPKLLATLHRVQARMRGLITRKNVRSGNYHMINDNFLNDDNNGLSNFMEASGNSIVSLTILHLYFKT